MTALAAIDQLVGLQAQVPNVPYVALWSRLRSFDPDSVSALLLDRRVVRAALMRTTVHLVTAEDALELRPLLEPVLARTFGSTSWGQALRGHDVDAIIAAGRERLTQTPTSRADLRPLLAKKWPELDPEGMAQAVAYLVPTVQVPPRGVWGRGGQAVLASLEGWLQRPVGARPSIDAIVLRYLAAFGPASVKDIQAWCGLTKLREVTSRLGNRLRTYRTEEGGELFDVPDGHLPDPETPAPVRFLPEYDNALLSYADRSRFAGGGQSPWLQGGPGGYVGTVLIDGFVNATWAIRRDADTAAMEINEGVRLTRSVRDEVRREGLELMRLVAPGARHDIRFVAAGVPQ